MAMNNNLIPLTVIDLNAQQDYSKRYYSVKIYIGGISENPEPDIIGYLTSPMQQSLHSDWDTIMNMDNRLTSVQSWMGIAGRQIFNNGIFTERFYKGGSYLDISPTFRVLDVNGDGAVILAAKKLLALVAPLPGFGEDIGKVVDDLYSYVHSVLKGNKVNEGEYSTAPPPKGFSDAVRKQAVAIFKNGPPLCTVIIGNYFRIDGAITESTQVTYSKECTGLNGEGFPLYADFTVKFSSKSVATTRSIDGYFSNKTGRIEVRK
jgi:hypothetical protein